MAIDIFSAKAMDIDRFVFNRRKGAQVPFVAPPVNNYALDPGNLFTNPDDLTAASWTNANGVTATTGFQAPDGSMTASRLVDTVAGNFWMTYQSISFSARNYTLKAWVKSNTASTQKFQFGFDNSGALMSGDLIATGSWQQFSFVTPAGFAGGYDFAGIYHDSAEDTADILVWHVEVYPS